MSGAEQAGTNLPPHTKVYSAVGEQRISSLYFYGSIIAVSNARIQDRTPFECDMIALSALGVQRETLLDLCSAPADSSMAQAIDKRRENLGLVGERRTAATIGKSFLLKMLQVEQPLNLPFGASTAVKELPEKLAHILHNVSQGRPNEQIASANSLTEKQVGEVLGAFKEMYGLRTDAAAVTFGVANRVLVPEDRTMRVRPRTIASDKNTSPLHALLFHEDASLPRYEKPRVMLDATSGSVHAKWRQAAIVGRFGRLADNDKLGVIQIAFGAKETDLVKEGVFSSANHAGRLLSRLRGTLGVEAKTMAHFISEAFARGYLTVTTPLPPPIDNLKDVDRDILQRLANGEESREISEAYSKYRQFVTTRLSPYRSALGVPNITSAVMAAYLCGDLSPKKVK